jgi:hypothetical protein
MKRVMLSITPRRRCLGHATRPMEADCPPLHLGHRRQSEGRRLPSLRRLLVIILRYLRSGCTGDQMPWINGVSLIIELGERRVRRTVRRAGPLALDPAHPHRQCGRFQRTGSDQQMRASRTGCLVEIGKFAPIADSRVLRSRRQQGGVESSRDVRYLLI